MLPPSLLSDELSYYSGASDYDQRNTLYDPIRLAVSSIIDLGVSVADSVTLGMVGFDTTKALSWVDENLGSDFQDFYEENETLVNIGSFVGGIVLPGLAVSRALRAAKAGRAPLLSRAFQPMDARIQAYRTEAVTAYTKAGEASKAHKTALSNLKIWTLGEGVAESLVYEAAFLGVMNQHAFMENDYSASDFLIGAGIGALAGPIKLAIMNKQINQELFEQGVKEQERIKNALAIRRVGQTPGHILSNYGVGLAESRKIRQDPAELANLSTQQKAALETYQERILGSMSKQIENMLNSELKAKVPNNVIKAGPLGVADDAPLVDAWDADPLTMLRNIAKTKLGIFSGVEKFGTFSTYDWADDILEVAVHRTNNEIEAIDGELVRRVVTTDPRLENLDKAKTIAEDAMPSGISVRKDNATSTTIVDITNTANLKSKEFKTWFNAFASLPENSKNRLILRSSKGGLEKFRAKTERLLDHADVTKQYTVKQTFHTNFITPDDVADWTKPQLGYGVIDSYFGDEIIDSVNARLAGGAAIDPDRVINKAITWSSLGKYAPTKNAVSDTDGQFIEILHALNNDKRHALDDIPIAVGDTHKLHAAYVAKINDPARSFKIEVVEEAGTKIREITDKDELARFVLDSKFDDVNSVLARGGTVEQAARATNLPVETVEVMLAAKAEGNLDKIPLDKIQLAVYIDLKNPDKYLKEPIKLLGKDANYGRLEAIREVQVLDHKKGQEIHEALVRQLTHTSKVEGLPELHKELFDNELWYHLRDNVENAMANYGVGGHLLVSADFSLRRLGTYGEIVTTFGQRLRSHLNKRWTQIAEQLTPALQAIARDEAGTLQFEQIKRARQASKDTWTYLPDEGKFATAWEKVEGGNRPTAFAKYVDSDQEIVLLPTTKQFVETYLPISSDYLNMINLNRAMNGIPKLKDRGFWLPYESVSDEFIAFKVNRTDVNDIQIVTATSADQLKARINTLQADADLNSKYRIVTRNEVNEWNDYMRYADLQPLEQANPTMQASGVAAQLPRPDASGLTHLTRQLQTTLWRHHRTYVRTAGADLFHRLEQVALANNDVLESSAGLLKQKVQKKVSPPERVASVLLNTSHVKDVPYLDMANNATTVAVNRGMEVLQKTFNNIKRKKGVIEFDDFEKITKIAKDNNIPVPYKNVEEFLQAQDLRTLEDVAQHKIAQAQGLLATLALRLMDMSHVAVTLLSTPVILAGETSMQGQFPFKIMLKSAKWLMQSEEAKAVMARAKDQGHVASIVSETTEIMKDLGKGGEQLSKGKFRTTLDKIAVGAADWSESFTRELSYAVGYNIAKERGVTDPHLLEAAAANFTLRTMGNYISRQKPTLFQGSFGSMLGLFQTFMITMGQNIYRYTENLDISGGKKGLAYLMGAQASMFGIESLPFYHPFNRVLGAYLSDEHADITTVTYDAFGNDNDQTRSWAEFLLYGAPSTLMQTAFYTRSELQPRAPLRVEEGVGIQPAILDALWQAVTSGSELISSVSRATSGTDMGHAVLQGFAAQNIWRPGARWAEIAMGRSYDRKGELIAGPDEVRDIWPITARLFASRPLEEQALKSLKFHTSYYNRIDSHRRRSYAKAARRIISTEPDDRALSELFGEYFKNGGSARGWRDIIKSAYIATEQPFASRLTDFAQKQPHIESIMDTYID